MYVPSSRVVVASFPYLHYGYDCITLVGVGRDVSIIARVGLREAQFFQYFDCYKVGQLYDVYIAYTFIPLPYCDMMLTWQFCCRLKLAMAFWHDIVFFMN